MQRWISLEQLIEHGLPADEATAVLSRLDSLPSPAPAVDAWREISQSILTQRHPFSLHQFLFRAVFEDWDRGEGPPPVWTPTEAEARSTNIGRFMASRRIDNYGDLYDWSVRERAEFWATVIARLGIRFARPYVEMLDLSAGPLAPRWLVGARMNIVASCFQADADRPAIVHQPEGGALSSLTYGQLQSLANRVSRGLVDAGLAAGDAVAIAMPMSACAVAIYLGLLQAGCVVVSIADSLAANEIATRLRLANAKAVFTQDFLRRGGKDLALYDRVVAAGAPQAIVLSVDDRLQARLRAGDRRWEEFLSASDRFAAVPREPDDHTNILFSSGTTGEPKAIVWTQTTPIKCAADAYLYHDIQPTDRLAWPTSLGWMMGPWLVFASLINRASLAIYEGTPRGRDFGQFVADARVTMLGVIPSLVKTWRASRSMESLDWSHIRAFSSTGECSNPDDMLYLTHLAGYKPVIEYCGGTEIGGGYISSTLVQPNSPSTFSTPALGLGLVILDESDQPADLGEAYLVPPSIGMSTKLLHGDHDSIYFALAPAGPTGEILRRHGDCLERLSGGYLRAHGRSDDTMNLGGIKVSSAEIERTLSAIPGVVETAAVAVPPPGGGPSCLWIFAVVCAGVTADQATLLAAMRSAIRDNLNPLFKIDRLILVESLPRTASNKVMRRVLRDQAVALGQCQTV